MFAFRPECCSESKRNGVRLQTGIAFAFDRIHQNWAVCLVVVLALSAAGCGQGAKITGMVLDEFGKPVVGATVQVRGTTFKTSTDAQGKYALSYAPGTVTVDIEKPRFASAHFTTNIATATLYPAGTIWIAPLPPMDGIWFLGPSGYIQVTPTVLSYRETPRIERMGVSDVRFTDGHFGVVMPPQIPKFPQGRLRFADTIGATMKIVRLNSSGEFLTRHHYLDGTVKDEIVIVGERDKAADQMQIRETNLLPGDYAFVPLRQDAGWGPQVNRSLEPVYFFRVVDR